MNRRMRVRRRRGFTLIEVLLVLVILVVIVSLGVTSYSNAQKRAYINAAKSQIGLLEEQLDMYQLDVRNYPTTEQGLAALISPPADLPNPDRWGGSYLKKNAIPLDPWDNEYRYESPGKYNTTTYDLWSPGPDGADNTDDDIGNWVAQ